MPKINQEEYEKIKLLPDYDWNWIAREKTGKILSFTNKPAKTDEVWKDKQTRLWFNYKDSQLFQFIQWEDEEPYNIAELIEEYESEEAEVKNVSDVIEKIERTINVEGRPGMEKTLMRLIINDLEKLYEPEVLSHEWVRGHEQQVHPDHPSNAWWVASDDLQNLLVPKQELPVIPKFVADWIERQKQPDWDYDNKEDALADSIHFTLYSLEANYPETNTDVNLRKQINEWLNDDRKNYWKLIDGVRYGYEVEKEQKYRVENSHGRTLLAKMIYSHKGKTFEKVELYNEFVIGYKKELTEQEIKDYDERFWSFAIKVEELEE